MSQDPNDDKLITVRDVYNAFAEHLKKLDDLWPETDRFGPRKVHIVELLDGIKLRLVQKAEKNASHYDSPFDRAAAKVMGAKPPQLGGIDMKEEKQPPAAGRTQTPMEEAHRAAQARMARYED